MHSVRVSNVLQGRKTVAVIRCYLHSLISWTRNFTSKNWSHHGATFVISTPSTIASSISLSSAGGQQNWFIGAPRGQQTSQRWKGMWENVLMTCHTYRFSGELLFLGLGLKLPILSIIHQLRKLCSPFHQHLWSRPDWSRSSLGKLQIPWALHTATRYGFKAEKGAWAEVQWSGKVNVP